MRAHIYIYFLRFISAYIYIFFTFYYRLISSWKICNGLKMANVSTWTRFMDLYLQAHKDLVLELLTCSENTEIIINYLQILRTMSDNTVITKFQYVYTFDMIVNKYASNDIVLDYILKNIDNVKPR